MSRLKHSIYGKLFGVSFDDYAYGEKGFQDNVEQATSASTGTDLEPHGHTRIITGAADNFRLTAPVPGVRKSLSVESTATNNRTVTAVSGTFQTTAGSSFNRMTFNAQGEGVELMGATTALWAVKSNIGGVTFSTV